MKQAIVWLIAGVLMCFITSCKTHESIDKTEKVYVHDTTILRHTDTSYVERIKTIYRDTATHDTIKIVLDDSGKIKYKEVIRDRYIKVADNDSIFAYRAKLDSLRASFAKDKETYQKQEIVREKTNYSGWWAFSILLAIVALIITKKKLF